MHEQERLILGQRLRKLRLTNGISADTAAKHAQAAASTWRRWEAGERAYQPWRVAGIAAAIGVPVAQLFTDEHVVAEIRLSPETLRSVKTLGRSEAERVAGLIAGQLAPLVFEAATRKAVDLRPGARPKRRRTRAQVLAGVREARRLARR